jgi:citrate lyase beta subunit
MPLPRLRRSLLITPANRDERVRKAATLAADAIVLDLEDGVQPSEKPKAREVMGRALASLETGRRERILRVNAVGTPEYAADMAALAAAPHERLDAIFLPKVESADQVRDLAARAAALEAALEAAGRPRERSLEIIATIETARGLFRALEIADAHPRVTALFFGSGDYSAETGGAVTAEALAVPRALIVAAAGAARIQAIDAAYFEDVRDLAATERDARLAKELGYVGKLVFHPDQLAPVNRVFTPTPDEVAGAHRIVAAYRAAVAEGRGTIVADGRFIAIDIVRMAERTIALAAEAAERDGGAPPA